MLRNSWRSARSRHPLGRFVGAALLVAALWAALYTIFFYAFNALDQQYSDFFTIVLSVLFAAFFLIMFVLLTLSNALVNHASLFRSWEAMFLHASPAPTANVFWHKVTDSVFYSLWALALLGLPIIIAFGRATQASWSYYVVTILALIAFILIPVALGAVITLLFARFVLASRRRLLLLGLLAVLLVAFLTVGELVRRHTQQEDPMSAVAKWIEGPLSRLNMARNPFLPSSWLADCIVNSAVGDRQDVIFPLCLLGANALFFAMLAYLLAEALYNSAFYAAQEAGSGRRRVNRAFYKIIEVLLPTASTFKRLLIVKDLKVFLRTPVQWSQTLLFFGVLVVYFVNIQNIQAMGTGLFSKELCLFVNFVASTMTICTLAVRFAFPMISLEGLSFWVLGPLPIKRSDVLEAKFLGVLIASLLCGIILVLVSDLSLGVSSAILALHLVAAITLAFGLSALSVGLGAIYPAFDETSPSKIAAGFGGVLNLVLSLGFATLVLVFLVLPFHLPGEKQNEAVAWLWKFRAQLAIGVIILAAVTTLGITRLGVRALQSQEA